MIIRIQIIKVIGTANINEGNVLITKCNSTNRHTDGPTYAVQNNLNSHSKKKLVFPLTIITELILSTIALGKGRKRKVIIQTHSHLETFLFPQFTSSHNLSPLATLVFPIPFYSHNIFSVRTFLYSVISQLSVSQLSLMIFIREQPLSSVLRPL